MQCGLAAVIQLQYWVNSRINFPINDSQCNHKPARDYKSLRYHICQIDLLSFDDFFGCVLQEKIIRKLAFQYSNLLRRYLKKIHTLEAVQATRFEVAAVAGNYGFQFGSIFEKVVFRYFRFRHPIELKKKTHAYLSKTRLKQFMNITPPHLQNLHIPKDPEKTSMPFGDMGAKRSLFCKNFIFQMFFSCASK